METFHWGVENGSKMTGYLPMVSDRKIVQILKKITWKEDDDWNLSNLPDKFHDRNSYSYYYLVIKVFTSMIMIIRKKTHPLTDMIKLVD